MDTDTSHEQKPPPRRHVARHPAMMAILLLLPFATVCTSGGPAATGSNTGPIVVLTGAPIVDAGQPIGLSIRAEGASGLVRVAIQWGDGTVDAFEAGGATVFEQVVTHAYGRVGTFRVEAEATDSRSATGRAELSIAARGGSLEVALDHAPGSARLIARASITTGMERLSIRDGQVVRMDDLVPGERIVSAEAIHENCVIDGDPIRAARVAAGTVTRVAFSVTCGFVPEERIAYNTQSSSGNSSDIFSIRTDGSDRRQLTDQAPGTDYPKWSPDGTRILFEDFVAGGRREIWIMNHDGTEASSLGRGGRPAWSPDGSKVAFELNDDLAVADLDGDRLTNVRLLTGDGSSLDDEGPAWSPDGSTIAFHRGEVVHLIGADGIDLRALVPGVAPVWMPDGTRIVFAHRPLRQIATMRPDGTDVRVLTNLVGVTGHPYPSPAGDRIVFHSLTNALFAADPHPRIWVMNADGSDPHVVEELPFGAGHPSWSP